MKCPNCGEEISGESNFCIFCGSTTKSNNNNNNNTNNFKDIKSMKERSKFKSQEEYEFFLKHKDNRDYADKLMRSYINIAGGVPKVQAKLTATLSIQLDHIEKQNDEIIRLLKKLSGEN
ncbi:MAG: zinc-ribbon domain-containing protein [Methanobacteriaceae archaeon]|nr:zinc-ribbon domain-containing protein [Methanobacteriaceae archaeon]